MMREMGTAVPSFTEVLRAYRFLRERVFHTPLEFSPALSAVTGGEIFIKWENQQKCRSFKVRGALHRMFSLTKEERALGVGTASSGNHAQGVALAARMWEVHAKIFVPEGCPEVKRDAIRRLGGNFVELQVFGPCYDATETRALAICREEGRVYVSPYEDPFVVAGQGTVGVEMFLDEPDLEAIVCPISGGGLAAGIVLAARALGQNVAVWGAHAAANPSWPEAFRCGAVNPVAEAPSLADALSGAASSRLFPFLRRELSGLVAIPEEALGEAVAWAHRVHHQIIEGGAAVAVAALLSGIPDLTGRRVGVVISGGNIDERHLLPLLGVERKTS